MDGSYAIKKFTDYLFEPSRNARTKPQVRSNQVLATVLNCYEDWLSDPSHTYDADEFRKVPQWRQPGRRKMPARSPQAAPRCPRCRCTMPRCGRLRPIPTALPSTRCATISTPNSAWWRGALARHQRAGRLEHRDGHWHMIADARPVTYVPRAGSAAAIAGRAALTTART